jgi:XisH protein
MPARDTIHDTIKNALIKDGWTILANPYFLRYEDKSLIADLKAAKIFLARRETETIVVEVKSFLSASFMKELQTALASITCMLPFWKPSNERRPCILRSVMLHSGSIFKAKRYRCCSGDMGEDPRRGLGRLNWRPTFDRFLDLVAHHRCLCE